MRLALLTLIACGGGGDDTVPPVDLGDDALDEDAFLDQYEEIFCEAHEDCAGTSCDDIDWGERCQYDAHQARLCLDGVFFCEESQNLDNRFINPPDACSEVYSYCP